MTTNNNNRNTNQPENKDSPIPDISTSKKILKELQSKRGSKIITYIVSTRQGVGFQIADDAVRIIYDHLEQLNIKKGEKLDLFLHSFGGVGAVSYTHLTLPTICSV